MKRRLLIVVVFLLAGAVVNVAVAWGCMDYDWLGDWPQVRELAPEASRQFNAAVQKHGLRNVTRIWGAAAPGRDFMHGVGDDDSPPAGQVLSVCRVGWPLYALTGHQIYDELGVRIRGQSFHGVWVTDNRVRPTLLLIPIWPGFVVNTFFYAAVLGLMFCGLFALRRHIRVAQGFCPACKYPMGESDVCTECGETCP